ELGALGAASGLDQHVGVDGGEERLAHAHDLVAAVDGALGELDGGGCGGRDVAGDLQRLVELGPGCDDVVDDAHGERAAGVDVVAEDFAPLLDGGDVALG